MNGFACVLLASALLSDSVLAEGPLDPSSGVMQGPPVSGPGVGERLRNHLRLDAAVGPRVWCLMCDYGRARRFIVFIRDLDEPSMGLLHWLESQQPDLAKRYDVRTVVVWTGGDKDRLSRWADRNPISELWLTVSAHPDDHTSMRRWQLNPEAASTAVLLSGDGQHRVLANLVNLTLNDERVEEELPKHFQNPEEPIDGPVGALIEQLEQANDDKRIEAAKALGALGGNAKPAVRALAALLRNTEPGYRVRIAAANALSEIGPAAEAAIPALIEVLADQQDADAACYRAAQVLGRIGKSAVPHLLPLVAHPDSHLREGAIRALGEAGPEAAEAVPPLIRALDDKRIRLWAARALGQIGPAAESAVPSLIEALGGDSGGTAFRQSVAISLGRIDRQGKQVVAHLIEALASDDPYLVIGGAIGVGEIGPEAATATAALTDALNHDHPAVRYYAAKSLGKIGPGASSAVPALRRALSDGQTKDSSFMNVGAAAREALQRIQHSSCGD